MIRLAVVGTGHLGRIHARIARDLDQLKLQAIVDVDREARERVAEETGAAATADYRSLLGSIDAAIIATPTASHFRIAQELMSAGIHVLVEKPIASSRDQAEQLVRLARQQQVVLQVGHIERFNPALVAARQRLDSPKYIHAERLSGFPFRSLDVGVVLDLMIHDLDIVLWLASAPVVNVEALGISVLSGHEDIANARITFANGCVANLTASRASYVSRRCMQVFTGGGFAAVDFGDRQATVVEPADIVLGRELDLDSLDGQQREELKSRLFDDLLVRSALEVEDANAIQEEQRDFAAAIRHGQTVRVPGEAGRDALALAEQILDRIAEHAWDGTSSGRRGPQALPPQPILRPAVWADPGADAIPRREAG